MPRLRISLASSLLGITALCVFLGTFIASARREQQAAEALQAAGAKLVYNWQDGNGAEAKPFGPVWLRQIVGPYIFDDVVAVTFHGPTHISTTTPLASSLRQLHALPRLRELTVWSKSLDADCGRAIARLGWLEELTLSNAEVSVPFAAEASASPTITTLRLRECIVPDEAVNTMLRLQCLEDLSVYCKHSLLNVGPSNDEIAWNVPDFKLTDAGIASLPECRALRRLSLTWCSVTDQGMRWISELDQLQRLTVSSDQITHEGVAAVLGLTELKGLDLHGAEMTAEDIERLSLLDNLSSLRLPNVTPEMIPAIARLKELTWLDLRGDQITDGDIEPLVALRSLSFLDLSDTSIDPQGNAVTELRASLPQCSVRLPKRKIRQSWPVSDEVKRRYLPAANQPSLSPTSPRP